LNSGNVFLREKRRGIFCLSLLWWSEKNNLIFCVW
jgi:hypothetical protein